jgi:hypothetical protein
MPRLFVISTSLNVGIYAAAYESAVEDLRSGHDVALVIETRAAFAGAWAALVRNSRASSTWTRARWPRCKTAACPRSRAAGISRSPCDDCRAIELKTHSFSW